MTATTIPQWFTHQMGRMFKAGLAWEPSSLIEHWRKCQAFDQSTIDAAVTKWIGEQDKHPTPHQLAEYAQMVSAPAPVPVRTRELAEPVTLGTLPTGMPIVARQVYEPFCAECDDTGFAPVVISVQGVEQHRVRPCDCWESNPVVAQRRAVQAKYASGRSR